MTDALAMQGVSVTVRGRRLLGPVDLVIGQGEFVAVVGPNGAGKSTLLRAALGLAAGTGTLLVGGHPLQSLGGRARASHMAWLPQQPQVTEPLSALELVRAARFRFTESSAAAETAALAALQRTGAADLAACRVPDLSGGEQQRVALACLLAQDAPTLLLDEPANHLDPAQQITVYRLIGELWREGRTVLCVTHDVNLLRHVGAPAARLVGLNGGALAFDTRLSDPLLPGLLGSLFGVRMAEVSGRLFAEAP